eukprot:GHVP01054533.1.p1 GENE.GHVP01054533.1~~GHVP01054533.1.p1  ORF type:complete len:264 (+),score=33.66 GHVP01054533.1:32-823(+)
MILFKDLQDKITAASCDVEIPNYQLNHSSQIDDNLSEPQFRVHDGLFSGENFTHVVRSAPRNTCESIVTMIKDIPNRVYMRMYSFESAIDPKRNNDLSRHYGPKISFVQNPAIVTRAEKFQAQDYSSDSSSSVEATKNQQLFEFEFRALRILGGPIQHKKYISGYSKKLMSTCEELVQRIRKDDAEGASIFIKKITPGDLLILDWEEKKNGLTNQGTCWFRQDDCVPDQEHHNHLKKEIFEAFKNCEKTRLDVMQSQYRFGQV